MFVKVFRMKMINHCCFLSKLDQIELEASFFIKQYPWPKENQLCFLNTSDVPPNPYQGIGNQFAVGYPISGRLDNEFTVFNPDLKGSIFEDIYTNFPMPITRMRLMRIPPKRCYTIHSDGPKEIRYHLSIKTNEHAYFLYQDTLELMHVPRDGNFYQFDVERPHSAINFSATEERIHLVINAKL